MKHESQGYVPRLGDTAILTIVILFTVALFPYASNYVWNHPDERHYTDAAITMTQTGDYLSPRTSDGSLRFRKPILTYWIVAASYGLFGVSPMASRLPFLLAGAAIVYLTYRLAATVFGRRHTACLAAMIVASHPVLIVSSTRSIPDVFFCLFLLISASGFIGLMRPGQRMSSCYWAAYVGSGLAIATKGLPAVAFLLFTLVFLPLNPWQRIAIRRLFHMPSIIVASLIGSSWFVASWRFHGHDSVGVFWADQVTNRVTDLTWITLLQFTVIVLALIVMFVPWVLPVLVNDPLRLRRVFTPHGDRQVLASRYILSWSFAYAIMSAVVIKLSTRYLLLVTPLLSILLADALVRFNARRIRVWLRVGVTFAAVTVAILGATVIRVSTQLDGERMGVVVSGILICGALVMAATAMQGARLRLAMCLGGTVLMMYPLSFLGLRHIALPDQGQQLAARLSEIVGPSSDQPGAHMVGKPSLASKIRVCSEGQILVSSEKMAEPSDMAPRAVLVISEDDMASIDLTDYDVQPGSQGFKDLDVRRVARCLLDGTLADYLQLRRQRYHIAVMATATSDDRYAEQPSLVR